MVRFWVIFQSSPPYRKVSYSRKSSPEGPSATRTLFGPVHTCFNLVLAQYPVPVVLRLPGVHNALLRQVGSRTEAEQTAGGEADIGDGLIQLLRRRFRVADGVATELHVETSPGSAGFIDHMGVEVVRPANQSGLGQRRDVKEVSG